MAEEPPFQQVPKNIKHEADLSLKKIEHTEFNLVITGALMSAILAVFAAITSMISNNYSSEAMLDQIKSSDQWNFYQAKSIKATVTEMTLFMTTGEKAQKAAEKIVQYKKDQERIKKIAEDLGEESVKKLKKQGFYSRSVTSFQVAIGIIAIGVLARRREFLFVSILLALVGIYYWFSGFYLY